jgi:hypothetical protein
MHGFFSCTAGIMKDHESRSTAQTISQLDMARTFFEKLWWYEQVGFDALRHLARREET